MGKRGVSMNGISIYHSFLAMHRSQLVLSGVPQHFWENVQKKLADQIFDAGLSFQLVKIDYEDGEKKSYDPSWSVIAIREMDQTDPNHIYLVDHAWTFKANSIKSNLRNIPGLLERMCNLVQATSESREEQIEEVSRLVWKYANTYTVIANEYMLENRVPLWYVMDELGSGITHSDNANFRAVPFIYIPDGITYTLIFPIKYIEEGDTITRNVVEVNYTDLAQKEAMLIPWKYYEHFDKDFTQVEPDVNYFLEGHTFETLPDLDLVKDLKIPTEKLKVYSEYDYINQYLTAPEFEIVDNENDADILWYVSHFTHYGRLSENSPHKLVNQFPFEYVITSKDLLAIIARRASTEKLSNCNLEMSPAWWPITFNMKTELPNLVSYFMQRKKKGLNNHWICKPFNLARGLDTYITDNLNFICRLPLSGPKIAQKYIENPVLFERPDVGLVKFDIRYVIILKSVNPTEVYIYSNFFLRFSNKEFSLDDFENYEKHFTVMNYTEGAPLFKLLCSEFKEEWAKQYPNYDWTDVEKSIFRMFSELFVAATAKDAPSGIGKSPQSRALYAADLMLKWQKGSNETTIQPCLLEVNWMPDCQRACHYYPDFYNDIFQTMFLGKETNTCIKIL